MERNNHYPIVLVHGFMGYGDEDGVSRFLSGWGFGPGKNAVRHLRQNGFECYGPAVGPINNLWDRACELYYHIVGGTVDYGKYHSEKYGHARYGRTYPGILKDIGTPGNHAKIHLVGHSFGGPTARMFAQLLTYGSEEERACTPENELSDLFKGGKGDWVASITTLAGVNNGTTLADFMRVGGAKAFHAGYLGLVAMLGESPFNSQLIDFHLEQWGVMANPETKKSLYLHSPFSKRDEIKNYNKNREGGIVFEMQCKYVHELNQKLRALPNVYYFARPACKSHLEGDHWVVDKDASLMARVVGKLTVAGIKYADTEFGFDPQTWAQHDGFVNTEGGRAPYSEPSTTWPGASADPKTLEKGKWYVFEPSDFDHTGLMGMGVKKDKYHGYFLEIAQQLGALPE